MYKDNLKEHGGELNNQTKRELIKARAEIKAGKFHTLAQKKKNWEYNTRIRFSIMSPPLPSLIPDRPFQQADDPTALPPPHMS